MVDVSGVNPVVSLTLPPLYPTLMLTNLADEGNPVDIQDIEVTGHSVSVNGRLVTWNKPSAHIATIGVLAGTHDDIALTTALEAHNACGNGKADSLTQPYFPDSVVLVISMGFHSVGGTQTAIPDVTTLSGGKLVSGQPGPSVDAEGKKQTKTFTFVFENCIRN